MTESATDTDASTPPATEPAAETPKTEKAAAKKPSTRAKVAKTSTKTGPRGKCAGCGKDVALDEVTTVGSRPAIVHHGCEPMLAIIRQFSLDVLKDPSTPAPEATK